MAIRRLAQLGEPILRATAAPVSSTEIATDWLQRMIHDMIETMRDADGVGIAAPQIFVPLRVCAIEVRNTDRYGNAELFPLCVVINPIVNPLQGEMADRWEGCLSVSDLRGIVPRHTAVEMTGLDPDGNEIRLELRGFPAIVAQHEADHLDGHVFLDRMSGLRSLAFEREYRRYHVDPHTASSREGENDDVT